MPENDAIGQSALRKATWRLVPLIAVGYGIAYMDRVNISFAALQMNRDLHFSASIYGLGAGLFFVSYALCELPSNLALVRFGARRWLARIMLTWGVLAMAMLLVRTPNQFYAMRFLLGAAEAGFFPGVVFYLTEWFPPEYRARTISRFYIALPLSSTVMGGLAGSLLGMNGWLKLAGWQWLFLLEGLPALAMSAILLRLLPDKPADAPWLTEAERGWLELRRIEAAAGAPAAGAHGWDDFVVVLRDRRLWMLSAAALCQLTVLYGWSFSAPDIVQRLTGLPVGPVGSLIAGAGLLGAVTMILNASHSDRTGERTWHSAGAFGLMGLAFVVGAATANPWIALPAFAVMVMAYNAAQGPFLAMPSMLFSGRASAIGYAIYNAIGIGGGFLGPYWMGRAKDWTGDYQRGLMTLALPSFVAAAMIVVFGRRFAAGKSVS
jgi:ACS family tartrate transporter-like MFS transporter